MQPDTLPDDDLDFSLVPELVVPGHLAYLCEGYRAPTPADLRAERLIAEKSRWHGFTAQKRAAALVGGAR